MGKCAVCGENFIGNVLKSLCGINSGITEFSCGFAAEKLFAHDPECVNTVKDAFKSEEPQTVHDALPDGPLKELLAQLIEERLNDFKS